MAANTKKPPTKSEIYAKIVDDTGLTRKDVAAVFESLNGQIEKNLGGRGAPGREGLDGRDRLERLVGHRVAPADHADDRVDVPVESDECWPRVLV